MVKQARVINLDKVEELIKSGTNFLKFTTNDLRERVEVLEDESDRVLDALQKHERAHYHIKKFSIGCFILGVLSLAFAGLLFFFDGAGAGPFLRGCLCVAGLFSCVFFWYAAFTEDV
ncbi:MAG: hypothetical protein WC307_06300 [Candidatus Nanoarchaeia archaeon]|jgi:hypothetical protein